MQDIASSIMQIIPRFNWQRWLAERDAPRNRHFTIEWRRIYILPSRSGFFFALSLLVMLAGAMNYNNSLGYMLVFLLSGIAIVSTFHTQRNLLGLQVEAGKAAPVFVGDAAIFELWLNNQSAATRYALTWQPDINYRETSESVTTDATAKQRSLLSLAIPATQRGKMPLKTLTVTTEFPLGLFHAWSYVNVESSVLVYPMPLGNTELPISGDAQQQGEAQPRDTGGEDFIGYRPYKPGDSPRHVDWKAVARKQEWLIKQFGGIGATTVQLDWEAVKHLNDIEAALSQLCLWILLADSRGMTYGLNLPGQDIPLGAGEQHRMQCLEALALFEQ